MTVNCPGTPWYDSTLVGLVGTALIAAAVFVATRWHERALARTAASDNAIHDVHTAAYALAQCTVPRHPAFGGAAAGELWDHHSDALSYAVIVRVPLVEDAVVAGHVLEASRAVTETFSKAFDAARRVNDNDAMDEAEATMRAELERLVKYLGHLQPRRRRRWRTGSLPAWPELDVEPYREKLRAARESS